MSCSSSSETFGDTLRVGNPVDCFHEGHWYCATVKKTRDNFVVVRINDWHHRYEEMIDRDSERLAPARSHECKHSGLCGQKKDEQVAKRYSGNVDVPDSLKHDGLLKEAIKRYCQDSSTACLTLIPPPPPSSNLLISLNNKTVDFVEVNGCKMAIQPFGDPNKQQLLLSGPWQLSVMLETKASQEARNDVTAKHNAELVRCKMLLNVELPKALVHSQAALAECVKQEEQSGPEAHNLIGETYVAHTHILKEIAVQEKKKKQLELPFDLPVVILARCFIRPTMQILIGMNIIDNKHYFVYDENHVTKPQLKCDPVFALEE